MVLLKIFRNARWLRANETRAEKLLWEQLKGKKLQGFKFRRQHPLGKYILDFYCHASKLVIEIDGGYHLDKLQKWQDEERTANLEASGLRVIRFTNEEVILSMEKVLLTIKQEVKLD